MSRDPPVDSRRHALEESSDAAFDRRLAVHSDQFALKSSCWVCDDSVYKAFADAPKQQRCAVVATTKVRGQPASNTFSCQPANLKLRKLGKVLDVEFGVFEQAPRCA